MFSLIQITKKCDFYGLLKYEAMHLILNINQRLKCNNAKNVKRSLMNQETEINRIW
jgi:hypothetical protein